MGKMLALVFSVQLQLVTIAQNQFKHPTILGASFSLSDFRNTRPFGNFNKMNAGVTIFYLKGINNRFDWTIAINGSLPESFLKNSPTRTAKTFLFETEFSLRTRLFPLQKPIQPYISTGIGGALFGKQFSPCLSIGPGVQFYFKDIYFLLNAQYKYTLSGPINNRYFYNIGLAGPLKRPKNKTKKIPVTVTVVEQSLLIPQQDADGDGLVDTSDSCPTLPGLAQFQGCPDSDGDGIDDKADKCPTVFGVRRYEGCPIPDKDGDGLNDEQDSCVLMPGIAENNGCPVIQKQELLYLSNAAQNIYFETGSATLRKESFNALDSVVQILKKYPNYVLAIEGHTDNVGSSVANLKLSKKRAKSVYNYLISQSILPERLAYQGFGASIPVEKNDRPYDRAKNRRVVFTLLYKNPK